MPPRCACSISNHSFWMALPLHGWAVRSYCHFCRVNHVTMPPDALLRKTPLIAILRGLTPARAIVTARAIYESGIRIIEVPLNSPKPFLSIGRIAEDLGETSLCGAGTVMGAADVRRAHDAGARLIVAPNTDLEVIAQALSLNMLVMPGIATATEAFLALGAGAGHLKFFPASTYGPA